MLFAPPALTLIEVASGCFLRACRAGCTVRREQDSSEHLPQEVPNNPNVPVDAVMSAACITVANEDELGAQERRTYLVG